MHLTIRLLGQARQYASGGKVTIEAPGGAAVDDLVPGILSGCQPGLASLFATDDGLLPRNVLAILRGETIDPAVPNLLKDGDELSLLPPMSGG